MLYIDSLDRDCRTCAFEWVKDHPHYPFTLSSSELDKDNNGIKGSSMTNKAHHISLVQELVESSIKKRDIVLQLNTNTNELIAAQ